MPTLTLPGYPRIGQDRELKRATERYWKDPSLEGELLSIARDLRERHWRRQVELGIDLVAVGDFSFYDTMLDASVLFGCVPDRYRALGRPDSLAVYFAMARGTKDLAALEMTKWFDTNYHYIVPEIDGRFELHAENLLAQVREARSLKLRPKPVVPGPYTFLKLAKLAPGLALEDALERIAPIYGELIARLAGEGVEWVALDEPALVLDDPPPADALRRAYDTMGSGAGNLRILLQTYFEDLGTNREFALSLPVGGIGLDLIRGPRQWELLVPDGGLPSDWIVVAGVVDGRNVWRSDLADLLERLSMVQGRLGERLWIGPSCSLLHLPYTVAAEMNLDPEVRDWICFAEERLLELSILKRGLAGGRAAIEAELAINRKILDARQRSERFQDSAVRQRQSKLDESDYTRAPFEERRAVQRVELGLPLLPTTTIGSFPQTVELRSIRNRYRSGKIRRNEYQNFIDASIGEVIRVQEQIGLDVLVHGEFERSDMVEYFAEQMHGMLATSNGWVQSYGTRYVRPPLIYGDVSRPKAMTVRESALAQSLTKKPVKGMLTGPVTILNWSFPHTGLTREEIATQIALALRDETVDLEAAGIRIIQIDEPAFREGLPLRASGRSPYLRWAVRAFRLASSGVRPSTQIHSHMCYSDFNEIIDSIAAMDADVISIENSRSAGELLHAFDRFQYPRGIGPGIYDVHSERVPPVAEMVDLIHRSGRILPRDLLWVNPDCGLKTRRDEEALPSLRNMVAAARQVRASWSGS